ncbi:hypothetical protein ACOBQX_29100 [Actinokineospora sp. G85]|uniref:hypothetical protein n=1 Tax=Actinokineospora sp. G85 TaxID=3406626 RepID=UPI003C75BF89
MLPEKDSTFTGTVVSNAPFGSFVEHPGGAHGLLYGRTVEVGSVVEVRVINVDVVGEKFSLELV